MAKKRVSKKKISKSTEIANWDEELARQAEAAAASEDLVGGTFFSTKGGVLSWQDAPLPDNQMGVIILASMNENVMYDQNYDADNPAAPVCFGYPDKETGELMVHQSVIDAGMSYNPDGHDCETCDMNQWGSADVGKGKACKNTRRLAMIPAGTFNNNDDFEMFDVEEHFATSPVGYMRLPVTSTKGFSAFVRSVSSTLQRPPHGIVAKVSLVPDAKTQFKIVFEALENVPNKLMDVIMARHVEVKDTIDFPYELGQEEEEVPPPAKKVRSKKKASSKKKKRY